MSGAPGDDDIGGAALAQLTLLDEATQVVHDHPVLPDFLVEAVNGDDELVDDVEQGVCEIIILSIFLSKLLLEGETLTSIDVVQNGDVGTMVLAGTDDGFVPQEVEGVIIVVFGEKRALVFAQNHSQVLLAFHGHGVLLVAVLTEA